MANTRQQNMGVPELSAETDTAPPFDHVRPAGLTIEGLKNVESGHIDFDNGSVPGFASVSGICGQNGSGKTAVIDAFRILRNVLAGEPLPRETSLQINVHAQAARFTWTFTLFSTEHPDIQKVEYSFAVRRRRREDGTTDTQIVDEAIRAWPRASSGKRVPKLILDTASGDPFRPAAQVRALTGGGTRMRGMLLSLKEQTLDQGGSYAFSPRFLQTVMEKGRDEDARRILLSLRSFGRFSLFPIDDEDPWITGSGHLMVPYRSVEIGEKVETGLLNVPIRGPFSVTADQHRVITSFFNNLSLVLEQIVPGLRIVAGSLGPEMLETGEMGVMCQMNAVRNGDVLPLACESRGILRIVRMLHLLIVAFNDPGATLAIDEMDSGIFEFLYGELVKMFSTHGVGQLIFTSHNLRPLEILDSRQIVCTTTDAHDRYIRPRNVKDRSNLRRMYFRCVLTGDLLKSGSAPLYESADTQAIGAALARAGAWKWPEE